MFSQSVARNWRLALLLFPLLQLSAQHLSAQQGSFNRLVHVTVSDPHNRFVTGLNRDHFEIVENGTRRPVTSFRSTDDPIAVAIVSESPLTGLDTLQGPSELIQTRSLSDAVQRLAASSKTRKALIITTGTDSETIPGGIFIVKTDVNMARKAIIEVSNQYAVGFMSSDPSAAVKVVLKQPQALPALKANIWK